MRSPAPAVRSTVAVTLVGIFAAMALTTSLGANATSYTPASYAARLLTLVNDARQLHGKQPLVLVAGTTEVAAAWTDHLAAARMLSHNPRLAGDLSTHGSRSWLAYGENVGTGSAQDPDGLFDAYMNSPEHRANILSSDYRYVGVAAVFTGARAWNTFDFVDVYRTTVRPAAHVRVHPVVARSHAAVMHAHTQPAVMAVASHSVARATATVSTPPVRPSRRAARPAGPVVVHVEALRHQVLDRPVARRAAESLPALPTGLVAPTGRRPGSRHQLVIVAVAVLSLAVAGRRWVLDAGFRG